MNKKDLWILAARRTALASPFKGLKDFSAAQLAGEVVKDISSAAGESFKVDEVILGNAVAAGTGQNLARQVVALAGLPWETPGCVINAVCGSGLQAVILGCRSILAGEVESVVAGGVESATNAPRIVARDDNPDPNDPQQDSGFHDGLFCQMTNKSMGELCEALAQQNKISRQEQDQFAFASQQKACAARSGGQFKAEIVGIKTPQGIFVDDERPRLKLNLERLAALPAAFVEKGTITAGNASSPADGAAGIWISSEDFVKKNHLPPLARILGYASIALDPAQVFTGAVQASQSVLKKCGLTIPDIDLFEITESFAAQAIYTQQKLKIPSEKMNILGGDVALGHPLGAAGSRALVTLAHALVNNKKKRGLVSVCFGGGGAIALVIENTV